MNWPATADALIREQRALAEADPTPWQSPESGFSIGGCFVCFPRGKGGAGLAGDPGWASGALIRPESGKATALAFGAAGARYEPGLLALREGVLLEQAVRSLDEAPNILLVNATGRDHPRGAGLALHLGAMLGVPSVGVTHRPLLAEGEWPESVRGAGRPLLLEGRKVGVMLCTRNACLPLAVHAGWRTDPETAVAVVLAASGAVRTPEPIRLAREVARKARAAAERKEQSSPAVG